MMDLTNATCATCPHWYCLGDREDGSKYGECRRFPPEQRLTGGSSESMKPGLPSLTNDYKWCCEHPTRRAASELIVEDEKARLRKEQADGR